MDVYQNIQDNKYVNKLDYPTHIKIHVCVSCSFKQSQINWTKFCPECGYENTTFEILNKDFKDQRKKYGHETARLWQQFKDDIEEEFRTKDNPKKDKLFGLAERFSNGSGYSEILDYYSDLVELVQ